MSNRSAARPPQQKLAKLERDSTYGFTLLEIILVISILGVIAGLSFPNLNRSYWKRQLNQTADHLGQLMRYAQSRAILKNQEYRLVINLEDKAYWLEYKDPTSEKKWQQLSGRLGRVAYVPAKVRLEADEESVNFTADGKMGKIDVKTCLDEYCLMISTKELNGYVYVYEF